MRKIKVSLPTVSFCGINFGNTMWASHLKKCSVCKNSLKDYQELKRKEIIDSWDRKCACGCEEITEYGNNYILGHSLRKCHIDPEWRKRRADFMRSDKNPGLIPENRAKLSEAQRGVHRPQTSGDKNPAKRKDVRIKISERNPMNNPEQRSKILEALQGYYTESVREERSKYLKKNNPSYDKSTLEKRIKTYSDRLSRGLYQIKNNWITGYYVRKDGTQEWFDSSYERKRMIYYDERGISWTKKHGIKIPYVNSKGMNSFYIPDFKIVENGFTVIEEIKGWLKEADIIKAHAAIKFCKDKMWLYRLYLGSDISLVDTLSSTL